jgi:hypothetical protein
LFFHLSLDYFDLTVSILQQLRMTKRKPADEGGKAVKKAKQQDPKTQEEPPKVGSYSRARIPATNKFYRDPEVGLPKVACRFTSPPQGESHWLSMPPRNVRITSAWADCVARASRAADCVAALTTTSLTVSRGCFLGCSGRCGDN